MSGPASAPPKLRYQCDVKRLHVDLRDRFVPLQPDEATAAYLGRAERRRLSRLGSLLRRVLGYYLSDYDVDGLLDTYPMHLLSTPQWKRLLPEPTRGRLLDVGAGSGDVTAALAPLFDAVHVTETAPVLRWRLERRGFTVHSADVTEGKLESAPYDTVSLLNVVDRCHQPRSLFNAAVGATRSGGHVLVAVPLPYSPVAYDGPYVVEPIDPLDCPGSDWETSVNSLVERTLEPAGLIVDSFSRVPYLAGADVGCPLVVYDDAVVVCRKASDPGARGATDGGVVYNAAPSS